MKPETLNNHIEALLFLSGEPMKISQLAKILSKNETEIRIAINELEEKLSNRGLRLVQKDNKITLGTAPDSSKYCEELTKEELNKTLGKAALETLAIIIYKGFNTGISRNDIDYIRSVNSTFTLRNLLIRGFLKRKLGAKRSYVYSPSLQLLQYLGITKEKELPNYDELREKFNTIN